jgi:hypothetical protein
MKDKQIFIKKSTQEIEPFLTQELERSLQYSGASKDKIENILFIIKPFIYDGISSNEIYKRAFAFSLLENIKPIAFPK